MVVNLSPCSKRHRVVRRRGCVDGQRGRHGSGSNPITSFGCVLGLYDGNYR